MGPNFIENSTEDAEQQLSDILNKKATRDNRPENSNVVRDKTYNRPDGRATHRYPSRNIVQQLSSAANWEEE